MNLTVNRGKMNTTSDDHEITQLWEETVSSLRTFPAISILRADSTSSHFENVTSGSHSSSRMLDASLMKTQQQYSVYDPEILHRQLVSCLAEESGEEITSLKATESTLNLISISKNKNLLVDFEVFNRACKKAAELGNGISALLTALIILPKASMISKKNSKKNGNFSNNHITAFNTIRCL